MTNAVPEGAVALPITGVRKLIAARMVQSHTQIPGVHVVEECDVTNVDIRSLVARASVAIARLSQSYRTFNAHIVGEQAFVFEDCHVGVAVDTPRGLMVPVVRDVQAKSIAQVQDEIRDLASRAREGQLRGSELVGATVTVTSPGKQGGVLATPLINPPQTAIIGLHRATERAVVVNGALAIRSMLNLTVTFDHRLIDGATAGNYARDLRSLIERGDLDGQASIQGL